MKTLLPVLAALLVSASVRGEDFQPAWPAVEPVATHPTDWQVLLGKLAKYGWNIGTQEYPVLGFVEPANPPKGEHRVDYFEIFSGGEGTFMNSENWTTQVDPKFARRIIEKQPEFFWKIFGAWPADPQSEPRVAEFLKLHPEFRPILANRGTPVPPAKARRLLDFLDAHPDLRAKYSHLDIYVDQWILKFSGPDAVECDHNLIIENRETLDDDKAVDPDGGCGPAALAKHAELMKFWLNYQPPATPPAAAPAKQTPPRDIQEL